MNILEGLASMNLAGVTNAMANMFASHTLRRSSAQHVRSIQQGAMLDIEGFQDYLGQLRGNTREQIGERALQLHAEMGRLNAILADSGVVGSTHEALRNELVGAASHDSARIARAARADARQIARQISGTNLTASSRIGSVQQPAGWGTLFSNVGGLFSTSKERMTVGDFVDLFKS